jgi:hypothetical protein
LPDTYHRQVSGGDRHLNFYGNRDNLKIAQPMHSHGSATVVAMGHLLRYAGVRQPGEYAKRALNFSLYGRA